MTTPTTKVDKTPVDAAEGSGQCQIRKWIKCRSSWLEGGEGVQKGVCNYQRDIQRPNIDREEVSRLQIHNNIYQKPLDVRAARGAVYFGRLFRLMSCWKQCHPRLGTVVLLLDFDTGSKLSDRSTTPRPATAGTAKVQSDGEVLYGGGCTRNWIWLHEAFGRGTRLIPRKSGKQSGVLGNCCLRAGVGFIAVIALWKLPF